MATVTKADRSLIVALGPWKMELVHLTAVGNGETYSSKLANPSFAVVWPITANLTEVPTASVSGKTVTLDTTSSNITVVLAVFGDSLT